MLHVAVLESFCLSVLVCLLSAGCGPTQHPEDAPVELKEVWELTPNRYPKTYRAKLRWTFSHLSTHAYALSHENKIDLTLVSDLRFLSESKAASEEGVFLEATGSKPYLLLPDIDRGRHDRVAGRIDITPPGDTTIVLYYKTLEQDYYFSPQRISSEIGPGRSVFYFDLSGLDHIGRIRLDPGRRPGIYHVHEITIRTE
jgi:hypothetical protein